MSCFTQLSHSPKKSRTKEIDKNVGVLFGIICVCGVICDTRISQTISVTLDLEQGEEKEEQKQKEEDQTWRFPHQQWQELTFSEILYYILITFHLIWKAVHSLEFLFFSKFSFLKWRRMHLTIAYYHSVL